MARAGVDVVVVAVVVDAVGGVVVCMVVMVNLCVDELVEVVLVCRCGGRGGQLCCGGCGEQASNRRGHCYRGRCSCYCRGRGRSSVVARRGW